MKTAEETLLSEVKKEGYDDVQDWLLNAGSYNQEQVIIDVMNRFKALSPLEQSENKEEWVSVETDYPLDFEPVLVFTINKDIQIMQLQKYGDDMADAEWCDVDSLDNDKDIDFVTHWQPIPSLPKAYTI